MNLRENGSESNIILQVKSSTGGSYCNSIKVTGALSQETGSNPLEVFSLTSLGFCRGKELMLQVGTDRINEVGSCVKCGKYLPWKLLSKMNQKN